MQVKCERTGPSPARWEVRGGGAGHDRHCEVTQCIARRLAVSLSPSHQMRNATFHPKYPGSEAGGLCPHGWLMLLVVVSAQHCRLLRSVASRRGTSERGTPKPASSSAGRVGGPELDKVGMGGSVCGWFSDHCAWLGPAESLSL